MSISSKILLKFGIPEEYHHAALDNFLSSKIKNTLTPKQVKQYRKLYSFVKVWLKNVLKGKKRFGLFFTGSNGCGKSVLGAMLVQEFLKNDVVAYRRSMQALTEEYFSKWQMPASALNPPVLLIEEAGKEIPTKAGHNKFIFEYILKYRTERNLVTILSTNYDIDKLAMEYKDTVGSLLKGRFVEIKFPLIDLRQNYAENYRQTYFKE